MRKVAVIGVGMTKFSGKQDKTAIELFAEAAMDAINESNLKPKDIQALFMGNAFRDFAEGQASRKLLPPTISALLISPPTDMRTPALHPAPPSRDAFMWVASGFYDIVLVGGAETAAKMGTPLATRTFAMASDSRYEYPSGITFPGVFALLCSPLCQEIWSAFRKTQADKWLKLRSIPTTTVPATPKPNSRKR